MGLLDSVLSGVLGSLGGRDGDGGGPGGVNAALVSAVVGMLANGSAQGGLGGLLEKFQQGGLGEVAASWVGTGPNQPVSGDQIAEVLGGDTLGALAQQLGLGHGDLAGQLAQVLPQVVDQLTPNGQAPQGGLGDIAGILGQLMRR